MIEENNILSNEKEVADKMNDFFVNAVSKLNIEDPFLDNLDEGLTGIEKALSKFKNHPSILKIRENYQINQTFCFAETSISDIENEINRLNPNKTTAYDDIPAKILHKTRDIVSPFIYKIYYNTKSSCDFPDPLKLGNVTPVHKKTGEDEQRKL